VAGSAEFTPKRRLLKAPVSMNDAVMPITIPIAARRSVCHRILFYTPLADAPSAMRIPISCVRWLTEYEITA
jgi:hypothetical protein